ncbi:MAG: outer membrane lipoprotein carrier protein LolA [Rhodobacterales bacterium]|nr:outer membrane lipoprotein carrier protein LolA [Rhodobacterales bacterium]
MLAVLGLLLLTAAPAGAVEPHKMTAADKADVARVESYLNGLVTLESRFLQASSNGGFAEGTLYLNRPGRMRIQYDPPSPILMVADGRFLIYYDKKLEQVSYLGLDSTPAGILLDDTVSLSDGRVIITGMERGKGTLNISLVRAEDPLSGHLTLTFEEKPLALKKWFVVDAQGLVTTVSLLDPHTGVTLDPDLFRFRDPNFFKNPQ